MNVIATGDGALDKLQDRRDKTHGFRFQTVVPKLAFMTQSPANTTTFCIRKGSQLWHHTNERREVRACKMISHWVQVFQSPYHYEDQNEPLQEQVGKCLPVVIVRPWYHSSFMVRWMTLYWPFFRSTCETLEGVNVGEIQGEGDIKEEEEREMELLRCGIFV